MNTTDEENYQISESEVETARELVAQAHGDFATIGDENFLKLWMNHCQTRLIQEFPRSASVQRSLSTIARRAANHMDHDSPTNYCPSQKAAARGS